MIQRFWFLLFACLALLAPASAQTGYKIQKIAKLGDPLGSVFVFKAGGFGISALNDSGHVLFTAENEAGGQLLMLYADGAFTALVAGERDAPGGKWPKAVRVQAPASINRAGNATFAADISIGGKTSIGTFQWTATTKQLTAVALKGAPAVNGLLFEQGGGASPVITNRDEIVLVAQVKNGAGKAQDGVFLRLPDGAFQAVALPDHALAGGRKLLSAAAPSANDTGLVAFLGRRQGDNADSAYLWEQGSVTPLAEAGVNTPVGGKLTGAVGVYVNNANRNALVVARLRTGDGLFRYSEGQLLPVILPGGELPEGGKLKTIQEGGVSVANERGQHAFLATLEDKSTAAYLMDADGKLTRLIRDGITHPDLGKIPNVGQGAGTCRGIALNGKGQVALVLRAGSAGGPSGGGSGGGGGGDGDHGGGGGGGGDYLVVLTPNP